jgi:transcriptional regulator with XRE-family HTH domain
LNTEGAVEMVTHKTKDNKSLRQLAKELDVSHRYLSQVLHGKRPASEKIAYMLSKEGLLSLSGKQIW